ncbi:MAG: universal stress protein [Terracidiphilus sp.]|jgi:nucleotide-binding universal stress UspA family protein
MRDSDTRRWTHPETILVATDLSDLDHLMPFALEQARATGAPADRSSSVGWDTGAPADRSSPVGWHTGARIILLHVLSTTSAFTADPTGMPYYDAGGALEIAEQMMHPWCKVAARLGIRCDSLAREGLPTQQILAAVRQFHADRVLLGTRSRGKLGRLLIGSVAEQVLRSVYLPVITVGPEAHLPVGMREGRVVLHATTLRETSRPSAALACQVAAAQNAKLVLLHVLPPISEMERKGLPPGLHSSAMLELRILAAQTGAECCSAVEPVVAHGNPSIEILALAAERRASLIVLGAARRPAFEILTRDHTVHRVLAHARCPVLTLREPQAMPEETHAVTASAHR